MFARRLVALSLVLGGCSDLTAPPPADTGGPATQAARPAPTTMRAASPTPPVPPTPAPAANPEATETVAASHLLVAFQGSMRADPSIKRTKEEAKKRASEFLARAKKGEDFGKLSHDNSDDPSAKTNNGSLGRFTRAQMVKPFSDAAFALKPGQVSDLVETPFGYHIVKRTE